MSKNSTKKELDLISFAKNGEIRVNDTLHYNSEEPPSWKYDFCISFDENKKKLAILVYHGSETADYALTPKLEAYIENRRSVQEKICTHYNSIIDAILKATIPQEMKVVLLSTLNSEIHRMYPYKTI